jgi:hypothetical protein
LRPASHGQAVAVEKIIVLGTFQIFNRDACIASRFARTVLSILDASEQPRTACAIACCIVAAAAIDDVCARAADQRVIAIEAQDSVIARRTRDTIGLGERAGDEGMKIRRYLKDVHRRNIGEIGDVKILEHS